MIGRPANGANIILFRTGDISGIPRTRDTWGTTPVSARGVGVKLRGVGVKLRLMLLLR